MKVKKSTTEMPSPPPLNSRVWTLETVMLTVMRLTTAMMRLRIRRKIHRKAIMEQCRIGRTEGILLETEGIVLESVKIALYSSDQLNTPAMVGNFTT
jgi:hypothetical protein